MFQLGGSPVHARARVNRSILSYVREDDGEIKIMLFSASMDHIAAARNLMTAGDEASLRYAALEIRMAIELMFYKLLPSYKEELPDELLKHWQPKKIIDALIECDPYIEHDYTMTMAAERPDGSHGPALHVGRYKAVNRKLLRQYYHKIGSYLHAPMTETRPDLPKMHSFLNSAATRVEEYCRETTLISNFGIFHTVSCVCGRKIKRNAHALKSKSYIVCPDESCGAVFDLIEDSENGAIWKIRETEYICPNCKTSNFLGSHLIESGVTFTCVECGQKYIIHTVFFASPAQTEGP